VPVYLGLDSSTQSLTATAIETPSTRSGLREPQAALSSSGGARRQILFQRTLNFDDELPNYGTRHGVLPSDDPQIAHAPPLMWAEALDRMMARLVREADIDWRQLRAISGSAQQHGSVYLNATAGERLARSNQDGRSSKRSAACWRATRHRSGWTRHDRAMRGDRSPSRRAARAGASHGIASVRALHRAQIRKFADDDPPPTPPPTASTGEFVDGLLLAGRHAPIDPGDGSG
jgi:xylulokinase